MKYYKTVNQAAKEFIFPDHITYISPDIYEGFNAYAKNLLVHLIGLDGLKEIYPSNAYLREILGCSEGSLKKAFRTLKRHGFVVRYENASDKGGNWHINLNKPAILNAIFQSAFHLGKKFPNSLYSHFASRYECDPLNVYASARQRDSV